MLSNTNNDMSKRYFGQGS